MEVVSEKINNIERFTNNQTVKQELNTALKSLAKRERETRELTITIRTDQDLKQAEIIEEIDMLKTSSAPIISWQDKDKAYVKFYNLETRNKAMEQFKKAKVGSTLSKIYLLTEVDKFCQSKSLTRKPTRLEIQNVKTTILFKQVIKIMEDIQDGEQLFTDFKEGKAIQKTNTRMIAFNSTAKGIERIFKNYGGAIPIKNGQYQTRLFPRVNVKPYMCRECNFIGPQHQCPGKTCNNCGETNHKANECKMEGRSCSNCKKRGHRAKDNCCPKYIQAIVKEIERKDIPLEFYEEPELRSMLIKNLQLN